MPRQKEQKIKVFLTDDQKIQVLKDYDESNFKANEICKKWGISVRSLYTYKEQFWGIYESTKVSANNRDKIATLNNVKIDNSRKMAIIERKAGTVLDKVLTIMEYKLDIEEQRLKGECDQQFVDEKIQVADLTRFFQVAAPYFFTPLQVDESKGKTLINTHKYITNILNNQVNVNNKDKN